MRLRRPPDIYHAASLEQNHIRLRISPDVGAAVGVMVMKPDKDEPGEGSRWWRVTIPPRMRWTHMNAYSARPSPAIVTVTREDYVEEAWRIVDPVLRANTPVYEYEPGTWGPGRKPIDCAARRVAHPRQSPQ